MKRLARTIRKNPGALNKLWVALGGVATAVSLRFGIDASDLVSSSVELATALGVFLVPNRPGYGE